jgi:hypothetical protein
MGHNIYYLPRESWSDTDELFGENLASKFDRAYLMEMYIANAEGFTGENELFTKFGLEIRDSSNFIVARKTFEKYMPNTIAIRPREGDLLYVPVMERIFEIKYVEEELLFFGMGNRYPYIYELNCEMFRYNNEKISTGVEIIDEIDTTASYTMDVTVSGTENFEIGEIVTQGLNMSARVGNWDSTTRTLSLVKISGTIAANANVTGSSSGTTGTVINTDDSKPLYDFYNNKQIQNEADAIIDFTEINPFGKP